jgi:methylated-DNA-[protein]-cysteine S-methyltransferase
MTLSTIEIESPIGSIHLYGSDAGLTHCWFGSAPELPAAARTTDMLRRAAKQLEQYFAGTRTSFDLPLAAEGTAFQRRVWQTLVTIPFGMTWSYGDLARAIGQPTASRAVGAANGKNPIGIIVPCHRVIGANGTLTGYAGGLPAKQKLLAHEQRFAS